MYHSLEFLNKPNKIKKSTRNLQIIQSNLEKIVKYLDEPDILSLKLTCKPFYYYFVTAQLWQGLKLNIAQQKLQYFDDFDFEETQTKQITKKDKNIRIHSLKKQNQQQMKKQPKRQPSNVKQKGKIIKQNNQLLFRNTQFGFKRLLKTNNVKNNISVDFQVKQVDLPKITDVNSYIIKINDPWSVNMSKAQNLINFFKKINQFHNKFRSELRVSSKQPSNFLNKLKKYEQKCKIYSQFANSQPYVSIIASTQGAKQNLLIDQQLNKICRLFWNHHSSFLPMHKQISSLRQLLQKQKSVLELSNSNSSKESVKFIEDLSAIDESAELFTNFLQNNRQIGQILAPQFINMYFMLIQSMEKQIIVFEDTLQQIRLDQISWVILVKKPFFSQTLFQIFVSLTSKLIKTSSSLCPEDLTLSIIINKIKNIKTVSQALLNISKYFGKIKKQIQSKQKKGKESKTPQSIIQFLRFYQSKQDQNLYLIKNINKIEKIIQQFKQKISSLKNKIQTN